MNSGHNIAEFIQVKLNKKMSINLKEIVFVLDWKWTCWPLAFLFTKFFAVISKMFFGGNKIE